MQIQLDCKVIEKKGEIYPSIPRKGKDVLQKTPEKYTQSKVVLNSDSSFLLGNTSAPTGEQLRFQTIAMLSTAFSSMCPQFIDVVLSASKIPCKLLMEESGLFCLFFPSCTKTSGKC